MDMEKNPTTLERAYDDSAGVTAQFNLNLLTRINRELGGAFDVSRFRHRAVYDEDARRVELYLVSSDEQSVAIAAIGRPIRFTAGETIHTESCHKYSFADIEALAGAAGLQLAGQWTDRNRWFTVNLFAPACSS
jgi:uncharacterized SAM-dependent methyltransferase